MPYIGTNRPANQTHQSLKRLKFSILQISRKGNFNGSFWTWIYWFVSCSVLVVGCHCFHVIALVLYSSCEINLRLSCYQTLSKFEAICSAGLRLLRSGRDPHQIHISLQFSQWRTGSKQFTVTSSNDIAGLEHCKNIISTFHHPKKGLKKHRNRPNFGKIRSISIGTKPSTLGKKKNSIYEINQKTLASKFEINTQPLFITNHRFFSKSSFGMTGSPS